MLTLGKGKEAGVALFITGLAYGAIDVSRFTIDGGGVTRSTGGAFELSGTIGQPDAGLLAGGGFQLTGGFWFSYPPSDCNEDGLVNLLDHGAFRECFSGPAGEVNTGCECFDLNRDGEIDLRDFATAQRAHTGM